MPISFSWVDPQETILLCEFVGKWRWNEFQHAVLDGYALIRKRPHSVSVIVDTLHSHGLPPGSPFPYLGRAITLAPHNTSNVVVISRKRFTRMALTLTAKIYGIETQFKVVSSPDEAQAALDKRLRHQLLRTDLIDALTGDDHKLALRAVDQLRAMEWLYDGTLQGMMLAGVNLSNANLFLANFVSSNLEAACFQEANLFMANFQDANLYNADLYGATLAEANLHSADLRSADLRGANLHGAILADALVDDALFDENTVLPDGAIWTPGIDMSVFLQIERADSWYAGLHLEEETLPSRPPDWENFVPPTR